MLYQSYLSFTIPAQQAHRAYLIESNMTKVAVLNAVFIASYKVLL